MQLNVFMAKSGYCSRRKADELIKKGRVTVNGTKTLQPWAAINKNNTVAVDKTSLSPKKGVYIVFNKPRGVTTTLQDRFASKKIVDFIPKRFGRVYPIGRLDKSSRGLIILTNDGHLCYNLTHPKFEVEKEYLVVVEGRFNDTITGKLKAGVREGGDTLRVRSAEFEKSDADRFKIRVIACEGKKRHLRRLFEGLGLTVLDLCRTRIGNLRLGDLKEGRFKVIEKDIIYSLTLKDLKGDKKRALSHGALTERQD